MKFYKKILPIKSIFLLTIIFSTFLFTQNLDKPKVGLVLSGGGARGFAHIGVIKILDSLNITIDYVVGTSIGSIIGAMYSIGYTGEKIEEIALITDWEKMFSNQVPRKYLTYFEKKDYNKYQLEFSLNNLKPIEPDGFVYGEYALLELNKIFSNYNKYTDFSEFNIPFKCISVDLVTGNEVIFEKGILPKALRASFSIPTIFSPVILGDSLLVDGGLKNNLPTDIMKDMGADIIIAIDVGTPKKNKNQLNKISAIIEQSINILEYDIEEKNLLLADYIIKPDLQNFNQSDFTTEKIMKMIKIGEFACNEKLSQLLELKSINENKINLTNENISVLDTVLIDSVLMLGLNTIKPDFIKKLMTINTNQKISINQLNNQIESIYGLGYFKLIEYNFIDKLNDKKSLILNFQEQNNNELRFGIKWDNYNEILIATNIKILNIPFSSFRIENQFIFGGKRENIFEIYLPSRGLNYLIYPYLRIIDEWNPINFHSINNRNKKGILDYYKKYFSIGVGTNLKKHWSIDFDYRVGLSSLKTEYDISEDDNKILFDNNNYKAASLTLKLDTIDDILIPRSGLNFELFGYVGESFNNKYSYIKSIFDLYIPFKKHFIRQYFFNSIIFNDSAPYPLYLLDNDEHSLAGFDRWSIISNNLLVYRNEFIYKHKKDIYFHIFYNPIISSSYNDNQIKYNTTMVNAFGFKISLLSLLGPFNLTWSLSPNNIYANKKMENNFYFSAGYYIK